MTPKEKKEFDRIKKIVLGNKISSHKVLKENFPEEFSKAWELCFLHRLGLRSVPTGYYDLEKLKIIGKRYSVRQDFVNEDNPAYLKASRMGVLGVVCGHMKYQLEYWTKEKCKKKAFKYLFKQDFIDNEPKAYDAAHRHGWIDEICGHMTPQGNHFNRFVYNIVFLKEEAAYCGITGNPVVRFKDEFSKKKEAIYSFIENKKHYQEIFNSIRKEKTVLGIKRKLKHFGIVLYITSKTYSKIESQKQEKEMLEKNKSKNLLILNRSKTGGLGGGNIQISDEQILIAASQYDKRSDFQKYSNPEYSAAKRRDILDEVCGHMKVLRGKWNDKNVLALQKFSRKVFHNEYPGASTYACRKGLIKKMVFLGE